VLGLLAPMHAFAQPAAERWTYSVMPYVWLPSVDGSLRYGPPSAGGATPNVSITADAWLGEGSWFVPYHLDAGTGDSRLTWQGVLGVGHSFKGGEIIFAYRYLSYEQDGNGLIEELSFGGFGLGVNFRF